MDKIIGESGTRAVLSLPERKTMIYLVREIELSVCGFWIGLFRKDGILRPSQLYRLPTVDLLASSSEKGLKESESMMLADVESSEPRYIYLTPYGAELSERDLAHSFISALRSWSPKHLGLFFRQDIFCSEQRYHHFLFQLLNILISYATLSEVFLYVEKDEVNDILEVILKFKNQRKDSTNEILIFHP